MAPVLISDDAGEQESKAELKHLIVEELFGEVLGVVVLKGVIEERHIRPIFVILDEFRHEVEVLATENELVEVVPPVFLHELLSERVAVVFEQFLGRFRLLFIFHRHLCACGGIRYVFLNCHRVLFGAVHLGLFLLFLLSWLLFFLVLVLLDALVEQQVGVANLLLLSLHHLGVVVHVLVVAPLFVY